MIGQMIALTGQMILEKEVYMEIEKKLEELGYTVPKAAVPVANYAPGVMDGTMLYISGQLPMQEGKLKYQGKLGRGCTLEEGYEAAKLCALNGLGVIKALTGSLDLVDKIVKITGFVNCAEDFTDQPKVVNGASDLLAQVFGDAGVHSRSAVGAVSLPLGACCEVEMIVRLKG